MYTFIGKLSLLVALTIGAVGISTDALRPPGPGDCHYTCMHDPGSGCDGSSACCQRLCE